jgi:hypothetical protein
MAQRGDAELASVMRKLLQAGEFFAIQAHGPRQFTIDDTTVEITEEEEQMLEEVLNQ